MNITACAKIIRDGYSYVITLKNNNGQYQNTTHKFQESFEVLKALPQQLC